MSRPVSPSADPALNPSHHHHHGHLHHAPGVSSDKIEYTTGTTFDKPHVPPQSPLSSPQVTADEKQLGHSESDKEKGSIISPDSDDKDDYDATGRKKVLRVYYKKYKWAVHIFIGAVFTGYVQ